MLRHRTVTVALVLLLVATGCSTSVDSVPIEQDENTGWRIRRLASIGESDVYEIVELEDTDLPSYHNCANSNNRRRPPYECSLDLAFVPSPDYTENSGAMLSQHALAILEDLFHSPNPLNRDGLYADRFRPFRFYITEYRYPENTPMSGACNPGLPEVWGPRPDSANLGDVDLPAWDCNIALSTAGVELDLGFIMHRKSEPDRSRYNLFSSEYNSYGAILHELSHAAFAMSDEAPNQDNSGRFQPRRYPNVYTAFNREQCNQLCDTRCVEIGKLNRNNEQVSAPSGFFRCEPADSRDEVNLMYFYPQPRPGDNEGWSDFGYYYASIHRLQYIFEKCNDAGC